MKSIKTIIRVVVVIVAIVMIALGIYTFSKKGLNFPENGIYTANNILEIAYPYIQKAVISTIIILIYLMIRYNKLGFVKVGILSLISLLVVQAVVLSIMITLGIAINRIFFPVLLAAFVATILGITIQYEKKLKTS